MVYTRLHYKATLAVMWLNFCVFFLVLKCTNSSEIVRDKEFNFLLFSQPGDGVVFMAQTLEKIYREKLTLLPKPECEVKGRKMSEGISQHN